MTYRDRGLALLVVLLLAGNILAVKIGVSGIPPLWAATLRFVIVAALVVPFTQITRGQLPKVGLFSACFGTVHFGCMFAGMAHAEAGTVALLVQLGTPIAAVLGVAVLKEPFKIKQGIGMTVSFAGVAMLANGPSFPAAGTTALLLASASGWAASALISKSGPPVNPLALVGWSSLFSIPQMLILGVWLEPVSTTEIVHMSAGAVISIIYSALFASMLGYSIWYFLLKKYPSHVVLPYSLLHPVLAVFLGIVFLRDSASLVKLGGGLLVIGGVAIGAIGNVKPFPRRVPGRV